jgi:hypothetical protein
VPVFARDEPRTHAKKAKKREQKHFASNLKKANFMALLSKSRLKNEHEIIKMTKTLPKMSKTG